MGFSLCRFPRTKTTTPLQTFQSWEAIEQSSVSLEQLATATKEGEETSDEKSESTVIA